MDGAGEQVPQILMPNGEAITETALMICDRCLVTQCFGHHETMRDLARAAGWWFPSGFDICPACVPDGADR